MNALVSKDESLRTSLVYVGYLILKRLRKAADGRLSLTEVATELRKYGVNKARPMTFGLLFLYLAGVADFKAPFIYLKSK